MKYYSYSVKEVLSEYFGVDTLSAMRKPHDDFLGPAEREHLLPLSWQYADQRVMHLFLEERFLEETSIEDDYIAYLYRQGDQQCVLLMFMLYENECPFSIDIGYGSEIIQKWEAAGYHAKIVSQSVYVETYGHTENFRLIHHNASGMGTGIYELIKNNGKLLLAFDTHNCWPEYYKKLMYVSAIQDIREYECLFEPTVEITTGIEKEKAAIASGIKAAVDFFAKNKPVHVYFSEYRDTGIFNRILLAGDKEINIWVNRRNLITEIHVSDWKGGTVIDWDTNNSGSLASLIPVLLAIRVLDIVQIHGYATQLIYTDSSIRNYYLMNFEELKIPDNIVIDGYSFDERILNSATIKNGGICFDNGYYIPAHILFYHSYRQLQSIPSNRKCFYFSNGILKSKYLLPLKEFKSHFAVRQYWGNVGECFGPEEALLDRDGKRITDASFYELDWYSGRNAMRVCLEPTAKYGFIRNDGNWLIPPVYESADHFEDGCAKAKRKANGELKQFLITPDGREIGFGHDIDIELFDGELCPFNAAKEPVSAPKPGYYWYHDYDDVIPGKWGYVDIDGNVIVQPQYAYAVNFYNGGGDRAVVARLADGKLLWGAIDRTGKEVVPCIYESLYTRWGDALAFRRFGEELYGVMDLDGNIIVQPKFEFFEEYNAEHRLITVGAHEDALGVYSVGQQRMIIPGEYDCIDYGEKIISCEIPYSCKERYYDYSGKELDFSEYDRVSEEDGLIQTWKDRKIGYIKMDGTVVVPNILSGGNGNNCMALYRKGYIITGDYKQQGLATVNGQEILPQKYAEIIAYKDFVVASERIEGNWCVRDTLYSYDGTPILKGPYRNISYDRDKLELTADTPYGEEHFQILTKEKS